MKGDVSRATFDVIRYNRVVAQQGSVQLDADWNEQQAILDHRLRAALSDVFGHGDPVGVAVAPLANPGFGLHVHCGRDFDASSPGAPVAADLARFGEGAYTVEAWFDLREPEEPNGDASARAGARVEGMRATVVARAAGAAVDFRIGVDGNRHVRFERTPAGGELAVLTSRAALRPHGFSFVACVFTGRAMEIWIDGALDRRVASNDGVVSDGAEVRIGAAPPAGDRSDRFALSVEEVLFYDHRRWRHQIAAGYRHHRNGAHHDAHGARRDDAIAHWVAADEAGLALTGQLCASPGRCYVDGWMCESRFHEPIPLEGLAADAELVAYLDVWERYVGAYEDLTLRDPALRGIDTSGRMETIAQVKFASRRALRRLDARDPDRGEIAVGTGTAILQDNLLYRFEVHAPGAVATAVTTGEDAVVVVAGAPEKGATWGPQPCRRVTVDAAADWPAGQYLQIQDPAHVKDLIRVLEAEEPYGDRRTYLLDGVPKDLAGEVRVRAIASLLWSKDNGHIVFPIESAAPDKSGASSTIVVADLTQRGSDLLEPGDVVVIEDASAAFSGRPGFVTTIDAIDVGDPRKMNITVLGRVGTLGERKVLRKWDGLVPATAFEPAVVGDLALSFAPAGTFRTADFWLAKLRPDADPQLDWPRNESEGVDGTPAFVPPAGIVHAYGELAVVEMRAGVPHVRDDLRRVVRALGDVETAGAPEIDERSAWEIGQRVRPEPRPPARPYRFRRQVRPPKPVPVLPPPLPALPPEALLLAHVQPRGYEPTGAVVEGVVDQPVWVADAIPAPEKGPATAVSVDGVLYVLYDRGTLWKHDPSLHEDGWNPCEPYESIRRRCTVVAAGQRIYALGGLDERGRPSARVDCFDTVSGRWSDLPPSMHAARTHFAAAANDRGIVVLGGRRRTWFGLWYASKSVETFDIEPVVEAGRWRRLSPMPTRRYASAAVWIGNAVYLIGGIVRNGWAGRAATRRVDRLHVATQRWGECVPLAHPRADARAAALGGAEIVVAGGAQDDGATGAERIRLGPEDVRPFAMEHRTRFGLAVAGGVVYAIAGRAHGDDAGDVERTTLVDRIRVYRRRANMTFGAHHEHHHH